MICETTSTTFYSTYLLDNYNNLKLIYDIDLELFTSHKKYSVGIIQLYHSSDFFCMKQITLHLSKELDSYKASTK